MTKTAKFKIGLLCATAMTAGIGGVATAYAADANAQTNSAAADTDADKGSDIIVTATRRETTVMTTPINISAIGAEQLSKEHIDDIRDLGAYTPGVTINDTGARGAATIVMRGLSADDSSADGGDNRNSAVGMYLGDVPMYYDFKLIDLQRVEALLGPQGTLYGLGTLAGAIRYIPNRPDFENYSGEASGRVFGMSHSKDVGYQGYAVVNVPIVKDGIAFRSATGYYFTPGYMDYNYTLKEPGVSNPNPGGTTDPLGTSEQQAENFKKVKDANYERTFTSRNQLGFQTEGFKAFVTYAYQKTTTNGRSANAGGVVGEGKYEAPWRYTEPATRTGQLLSLEVQANVKDFMDVIFVSSYTTHKSYQKSDNTDLLLDLDYGYDSYSNFSSYNESTTRDTQYTNELRLVSTHGGLFSWVLGAFWNRDKYKSNYKEYIPGYYEAGYTERSDNLEYASYVRSTTDEKGLYGELSVHPTDKLQFTGGLRYYKYSSWVEGGTALPVYDETPYPDVDYSSRSGDTSADGLVYKLNASYNFTPTLMIYATWSTGYRIGGVNRVAPCSAEVIADHAAGIDPGGQTTCALPDELSYGPDKTKNAEIGARAQLFDHRLMLSVSAFHIDWTGIQLSGQTTYGAIGITTNGGKAVSKGVDVSFTARPIPGLSIRGNYSYLDAHLTEGVAGLLSVHGGGTVDAEAGDRLPGSAKNSGTIGATYGMALGENTVEFGWTAKYTGNILTRVGGRGGGEKLPAYWMHRASIMFQTSRFDIGLFADNVFDKYAVTGVSNDLTRKGYISDGGNVLSRYYARSVAQPRTVGLQGSMKF